MAHRLKNLSVYNKSEPESESETCLEIKRGELRHKLDRDRWLEKDLECGHDEYLESYRNSNSDVRISLSACREPEEKTRTDVHVHWTYEMRGEKPPVGGNAEHHRLHKISAEAEHYREPREFDTERPGSRIGRGASPIEREFASDRPTLLRGMHVSSYKKRRQ
jgi:hypothetical protein